MKENENKMNFKRNITMI